MSHPIPPALPHGALQEVLPNVFLVTGTMKMGPFRFSRNMTVVREGERLVIVNSVRLDDAGLAALDALGKVTDVIRLAGFHGSDDRFYKDRYDAKVWIVKGQTYFTGTNPKKGEIYFEGDACLDDEPLPIAGASLYRIDTEPSEGILRLDGGTLITGDSLQNWGAPNQYFNFFGKVFMRIVGFLKPYQLGPGWVKGLKPDKQQLAGILELDFENVLPGHGDPVLGGAPDKYRPAIEAYVSA